MKVFILVLMLITAMIALGDGQTLESRAYWQAYNTILEKQVSHLPKGILVKIELRDRTILYGKYDGYTRYSETIWINTGHWLDDGYSIREVLDIRPIKKI
jgi:hypothetical protein